MGVFSGIVLGFAIIALAFMFVGSYLVSYEYDKTIGSHIDNAYEVNTPGRMISEIEKAKQGMLDAGLTPQDYGAVFFKKPDNSMEFQYQFLDSIIERAKSVELWYNMTYDGKQTSTESLGDVYEQKMDNLREFIMENGRSDWIAKEAWMAKNHIFWYFGGYIMLFLLLIAALSFVFLGMD